MNVTSYNDDYDDEVCEKGEVVKFGSFIIPVFLSVVIVLSLMGNVLVLVILGMYENLKSLTNIFILNLAISDLVFTSGLPFQAIYHIYGWLFTEALCKIATFFFFTGFYSSILFLTIMTIHRYVAVVHPLSEMNTLQLRTGIFLSLVLWMISIGAATPYLLTMSLVTVPHKDGDTVGCEYVSPKWEYIGVSQQNIFFLIAFVVMAFCYIQILRRIARTRCHKKKRAVKLVFCIVAVFFLGWVPYNVTMFLRVLAENLVTPFEDCDASIRIDYAFFVCRLIAFSHCCLNPVLYVFVGVKFQSHLKLMLHQMWQRQSPVGEQQVRMQNLLSRGSMY